MNRNPAQVKKAITWTVVLLILAWAALTLPAPWARGQVPVELGGNEKFVPGGSRFNSGATLELRAEVNLIGEEARLKNVCRWSDSDKAAFEPVADLVLVRLSRQSPYKTITVRELRETLSDAGVNLAVVRFAGATTCTVARTDVKFDERTALEEWVAAKEHASTKPALIEGPTTKPVKPVATKPAEIVEEPSPVKSLRNLIIAEASRRLSIREDQLEFKFSASDEKLLNLLEPHFGFDIKPPRQKNLGECQWDVTISADGASQKASISATVRAWQDQLVVNKPLAFRQTIKDGDVIDRRTLVDRIGDDPIVTREQVVGQMAGQPLKSGTILTARLIEPTVLAKGGQLITVMLTSGAIQAKSVARALEQGSLGQTIRVKNEVTGNVFDVVLTGPQTARLATASPDVAAVDR